MVSDPRLRVGSKVYAKVTPRILNQEEAHRRFDDRADSVLVEGLVEKVRIKRSNGRNYKWLYCVWSVQGRKRRVELPLGHIREGPDFSSKFGISERQIEMSYPVDEALSDQEESTSEGETPVLNVTANGRTSECTPDLCRDRETQDREPVSTGQPFSESTVVAHDQVWTVEECPFPLNGPVSRIPWSVQGINGQIIQEGGAAEMLSPIDYFFCMFPIRHLSSMMDWTNEVLRQEELQPTSTGEILRFFGILVLMTRFKFNSRKDLWNTDSGYKYIPAANFGRIMSYHRFDTLRRVLVFSDRSRQNTPLSCTADERCRLCEGFLEAINDHRRVRVTPSDFLCVDESMSRWYGRGGEWMTVGLPHYVAMDRKPEAGCEVQDIACGRSGIMLGLLFVKSAEHNNSDPERGNMNHGTKVLLELSAPWIGSGRVVCADSYFASVEAASYLYEKGLRFTGVIKNSTKKFPMKYLNNIEMMGRGDHKTLVSGFKTAGNLQYKMAAVGWVDRNRRYFVSTTGSTTPGRVQERMRMRECGDGARRVHVTVQIPSLVEEYYSAAARIDQHNRCRQDDLDMEKTVKVREWSFRVNCTLLSVCVVDSWLLYKKGREGHRSMRPHDYYATLAEELIENNFDSVGLRPKQVVVNHYRGQKRATSRAFEHLTPTKRTRKVKGKQTTFREQQRCAVCGLKTIHVCSECSKTERKGV